jgi:ubiquinone/menaquinone biosynthesis C-methylase UbiE
MTADRGGPVGNHYDKYGTKNPVSRLLVRRFRARIDNLIRTVAPASLLDVGCGEGIVTDELALLLPSARVTGIDVPNAGLASEWSRRSAEYVAGTAYELPFDDGEFDLVSAIEVFEHLERPEAALTEMARVARKHVLVSVPREPLWRVANVASGRYLRELGNTPGHIQHFSRREIATLVGTATDVADVSGPLPWTVVLANVR